MSGGKRNNKKIYEGNSSGKLTVGRAVCSIVDSLAQRTEIPNGQLTDVARLTTIGYVVIAAHCSL